LVVLRKAVIDISPRVKLLEPTVLNKLEGITISGVLLLVGTCQPEEGSSVYIWFLNVF
jgi:hypothetical protein